MGFGLPFSLRGQLCFFPKTVNSTSPVTNVNKKKLKNVLLPVYAIVAAEKGAVLQCQRIVLPFFRDSNENSVTFSLIEDQVFILSESPQKRKHRCI